MASLRPDDLNVPIARHQYSLGVVASSVALVLRTGTRLQRVPDVLSMHFHWSDLKVRAASYYSVRLWLLRLGLYQLNRPKTQADDWMWIVDHTMQLGERKCLIIVAIRQSAWDTQDRILSHEDVELIDLVPVTESNGDVVYKQLQKAAAKTGVPRSITSDGGSDLHCGIDRFRNKHRTTACSCPDMVAQNCCTATCGGPQSVEPAESAGRSIKRTLQPRNARVRR